MKLLASLLLGPLKKIAASRDPDLYVGGKEDPYLLRWWLIPRNRFFNLYLHNVKRDDDPVIHDHPWASLSLVLDCGDDFGERFMDRPPDQILSMRSFRPGQWIYRSSTAAHQLIKARDGKPAWTLFCTGPVLRQWGFWCPRGWKSQKEYTTTTGSRDVSGTVTKAIGCGEE